MKILTWTLRDGIHFEDPPTNYATHSTTISAAPPPCAHASGTYRSIPARFAGRRTVFVCGDCENILDPKTKRSV